MFAKNEEQSLRSYIKCEQKKVTIASLIMHLTISTFFFPYINTNKNGSDSVMDVMYKNLLLQNKPCINWFNFLFVTHLQRVFHMHYISESPLNSF